MGAGAHDNILGDVHHHYTSSQRSETWLGPGEYLQRMNKGAVYTHRWRLVGRTPIVSSLVSFARDKQGEVNLLVGRGGTGKTKILTSLCEALDDSQDPVAVRVLDQLAEVNQETFEQLPSTGKLLVIVDDAHNGTFPLGKLIAGVQSVNSAANVLLSLRPYGLAHTRRELARVSVHVSEAPVIEIGDLEFEDATALADEVLDEPSRQYAQRLAAAARDCPLLIVTGAQLINRGSLDPTAFEGDDRLHTELTDRLADALTVDSTSKTERQDLLCALAAYQPAHLAEPEVRTSLEALTGLTFDSMAPHLSALTEAGVLLHHKDAVRVVPDLLGDALLLRATRHRSSGIPTGYLIRAMEAAEGSALRNLVVNAGRVDWQENATGTGTELIEPLWAQITAVFHAADARGRVSVLEVLAKVAFFQPRRTLHLAAWAVDHPAEPVTADIGLGLTHTYTDTDVQQALPAALQAVAYHSDFLPQAAGLLWHLGRDDTRATNQHPQHPLRVLEGLAGFTRLGPTNHQRILIAQVERWLKRTSDGPSAHAPLAVLAPLLATDGHDERWTPGALTFRPYVLMPTPEILDLRRSVLDVAFAELGHDRLERASAAVTLIGAALTLPRGGFGLNVTPEMQQPWLPHLAEVLARLGRYVLDHTLAPAILVAIRSELQWLAHYGPDDLRQLAASVLPPTLKSPDYELARALHGGPTDPESSPGPSNWLQAQETLFADVAGTLTSWTDEQVIARIDALLSEERSVFGTDAGRARPFIWDLITRRPAVGEALCGRALADPTGPFVPLVSIALIAMGNATGDRSVHWGHRLASSGNVELAREVAHAFGIQRGRPDLLNGEPSLLRELAAHEDRIVRAAALGAARRISVQNKELVIELLTASLSDGAGLGEFALALAGPPSGSLAWSDLSAPQKEALLETLVSSPSVEGYEIALFLAKLARSEPASVVKLLEARVETCEKSRVPGYSPLPFAWQVPPPFRDHEDFPALLRQIREWLAADPGSAWRGYLGAEVFALVAGPFDAQVIDVIDEYLNAPDPAKMKVVAIILAKAPRELVWDLAFVGRCLRSADQFGEEALTRLQGALHAAVITGMRSGTPGQPYAEDVEQHARATTSADNCVSGSVEEQFYRALAESAEHSMRRERHDLPPDDRTW
ncbi:hypothetical protein [Kitasatospora sp. NBC_00315]|uniref:hypothetical protein n=1 Tax=Kitasatospora sp. NBC_00315 TaxID=2975963 RepID=UPI0032451C3C